LQIKSYLSSQTAIISLISFYQKSISPYKGYSCAHRALHNGMSCSEWGKRAIIRVGIYRFFPLMRRIFKACKKAYQLLKSVNENNKDNIDEKSLDQKSSEFNSNKDKKSIGCCLGGFPCLPY
jgi:putative component of membrane protein insertase Oxa1/YidC/SpoIIIJ protein YidD